MTLKEKLVELDELVSKGNFEEAIEKYFHPRVVSLSNHDDVIIGKEDKLLSMRNFKESMARFNHIEVRQQAIGDNVTMSEYLFDFVYKFGKRVIKEEIVRRIWEDGMVIEERYYALDTRPPFNPVSKEGIPYLFVEKGEEPKQLVASEPITVNDEEDAEIEESTPEVKEETVETPVVTETTEPAVEEEEEVVLARGIPSTPTEETPVETETPAEEKEDKAPNEEKTPNEEDVSTSNQEENSEVSTEETTASTEAVEPIASNVIDNSSDGFLSKSIKTHLEIPDNTNAPLISTLSFVGEGLVGSVVLNLDLDHTYVGSLTIELESPYGERVLVQKEEGGSASSIKKSYSKYLFGAIEGEPVEGSWKLILSDNSPYDSGWLNEWGLEIDIA